MQQKQSSNRVRLRLQAPKLPALHRIQTTKSNALYHLDEKTWSRYPYRPSVSVVPIMGWLDLLNQCLTSLYLISHKHRVPDESRTLRFLVDPISIIHLPVLIRISIFVEPKSTPFSPRVFTEWSILNNNRAVLGIQRRKSHRTTSASPTPPLRKRVR